MSSGLISFGKDDSNGNDRLAPRKSPTSER